MSGYSSRCSHLRAYQMGTATLPLTTLKVTVGGRSATLARLQTVSIHSQAHRTTWLAPFKPGRDKNFIQTFLFGLCFHEAGARHDHRQFDARCYMFALGDSSSRT